jgi:hypothetical protein
MSELDAAAALISSSSPSDNMSQRREKVVKKTWDSPSFLVENEIVRVTKQSLEVHHLVENELAW